MLADIDQWIEAVTLQQKTLNLLQLIDKQRVPFSALHAIYKTAQDTQKNQDKRLLSSFNSLLFETISELPTPFVYERLGVKYRQIFIFMVTMIVKECLLCIFIQIIRGKCTLSLEQINIGMMD